MNLLDFINNNNLDFINHINRIEFGGKRYVINTGRRLGKTILQEQMIKEILGYHPIYIKKFYLRSGVFVFRQYRGNKFELEKISHGSKWSSNKLIFILEFLTKRRTKEKDLLEIERRILENL